MVYPNLICNSTLIQQNPHISPINPNFNPLLSKNEPQSNNSILNNTLINSQCDPKIEEKPITKDPQNIVFNTNPSYKKKEPEKSSPQQTKNPIKPLEKRENEPKVEEPSKSSL